MRELDIIREVFDRVYRWHRVPSIVKARAVLLYFRGIEIPLIRRL